MNFHHTSNSISDMNGVMKEPEKRKREGNSVLEIPIQNSLTKAISKQNSFRNTRIGDPNIFLAEALQP